MGGKASEVMSGPNLFQLRDDPTAEDISNADIGYSRILPVYAVKTDKYREPAKVNGLSLAGSWQRHSERFAIIRQVVSTR